MGIVSPKFEGDLFVHRQNVLLSTEPVAGKRVSFLVSVDERGRCTAINVTESVPMPEDYVGHGSLTGHIRSWRNEWGFIVAPDFFEGDIFCHQDNIQCESEMRTAGYLEQFAVRSAVTFEVSLDRKGRACAEKVVLSKANRSVSMLEPVEGRTNQTLATLQIGPSQNEVGMISSNSDEVLTGTLRSWRNQWGFIICPDRFDGDLFIHKDNILQGIPVPSLVGHPVQFQIGQDSRGRPHASQARLLGQPEVPPQITAVTAPTKESSSTTQTMKFTQVLGKEITGTVRSWKQDWGFIISPEHFEGDLFVHKENLSNGLEYLTPNVRVGFQVGIDSQGRPTALTCKCLCEAKDWCGSGIMLTGRLRSWRDPWGFIISPGSFNGDLFFRKENFSPAFLLDQFCAGMEVAFRIELDRQGRCTATGVTHLSVSSSQRPVTKRVLSLPDEPLSKRPRTILAE